MGLRSVRVLLLADTHLGFDLPRRPRVERRRRGDDFFANYHRALQPALDGEVDLVVHGGDVFFRSRVPPDLVLRAFEPLKRIADRGTPVFVVPGNHERSAIPYPILAAHAGVHVFDGPRSFALTVNGVDIVVAGFPCERKQVAHRFPSLLQRTGWNDDQADVRLLCLHQTVEGATVGPVGYVFRAGPDVIGSEEIPSGFAAVLTGHIHRHQVLTTDLSGNPLAAPVFYPGSIERTSVAERDEAKGYLILDIEPDAAAGGRIRSWAFHDLPARPMVDIDIDQETGSETAKHLREKLFALPSDAIVRIRMTPAASSSRAFSLTTEQIRAMAPPTMNIEVTGDRGFPAHARRRSPG